MIDTADRTRLAAITARHGYEDDDADARARILYFMQIGYHTVEMRETIPERLSRLQGFLRGVTGQDPQPTLVEEFRVFAIAQDQVK